MLPFQHGQLSDSYLFDKSLSWFTAADCRHTVEELALTHCL